MSGSSPTWGPGRISSNVVYLVRRKAHQDLSVYEVYRNFDASGTVADGLEQRHVARVFAERLVSDAVNDAEPNTAYSRGWSGQTARSCAQRKEPVSAHGGDRTFGWTPRSKSVGKTGADVSSCT